MLTRRGASLSQIVITSVWLGAALLLLVLSPVFLVLAVAIVFDTGRPVFFRQVRLGRGLCEFQVLKFRTMKTDATPDMHMEYIAKLAAGDADEDGRRWEGDTIVNVKGSQLGLDRDTARRIITA